MKIFFSKLVRNKTVVNSVLFSKVQYPINYFKKKQHLFINYCFPLIEYNNEGPFTPSESGCESKNFL